MAPIEVVTGLNAALNDADADVRWRAVLAIAPIGQEAILPALTQALGDADEKVRLCACVGFHALDPKVKGTLSFALYKARFDILRRETAYSTLARLAGKVAVPTILESIEHEKRGSNRHFDAAIVFYDLGDPRADDFMGKLLDDPNEINSRTTASLFFVKRGGEASLARMRKCLEKLLPPGLERAIIVPTAFSQEAALRSIAVEALGRVQDKASFDIILKLVETDPSINVRTAATAALNRYSDERGVPVLIRALALEDEGFGSQGHIDGTLRRTAVTHSFISAFSHHHLPALKSSPGLMALVHGAQPILTNPRS